MSLGTLAQLMICDPSVCVCVCLSMCVYLCHVDIILMQQNPRSYHLPDQEQWALCNINTYSHDKAFSPVKGQELDKQEF